MREHSAESVVVPAVPIDHLRAYINLVYPEEMTPQAKRILERIIEQYDGPVEGKSNIEESAP